MRVMYIAARYHTNQIPIMKGWKEHGDEVVFLSQYKGGTEDYSVLEPIILGYSMLFYPILTCYRWIEKIRKNEENGNYNFQAKVGLIPLVKFCRVLKKFNPDLVIMRDRSVYTMGAFFFCSLFGFKSILYNQTPYYVKAETKSIISRGIRKCSPRVRMTPVLGKQTYQGQSDVDAYYIPFVIEPEIQPKDKLHFENNKINLLCIGKYEKRKHHLELIRIVKELCEDYEITLTLAGECVTESHKKYFDEVCKLTKELGMGTNVLVRKNLCRDEVYREYSKADLFVLPSTGEFASVSQLEAMSCSLPVICSDTNGTSCYIENGTNGFIFEDCNMQALKQVLWNMISDREKIVAMGEESYRLVLQKYCFKQYKDGIQRILGDIK